MAYGQTSSGKSYTLLGGQSVESRGVLPRFVEDLFTLKHKMNLNTFEVKCSFFEIYNEHIYDLLDKSGRSGHLIL